MVSKVEVEVEYKDESKSKEEKEDIFVDFEINDLLKAKILEYIPGMGGTAGALKSFSPARIIHNFAGQMRGAIDAFEDGVTNYTPGEGEGMSLVGEAGPELVTLPRGSNVVTNENVNRLMGEGKAGPGAATPKDQVFNITLKLDSDVLARHTRKVAFDTMTKTMEFNT